MRYRELEHLSKAEFKRWCGVSQGAFREMIKVVRPHLRPYSRVGRAPPMFRLTLSSPLLSPFGIESATRFGRASL